MPNQQRLDDRLFIGVDGGQSSTTAALVGADGVTVGLGFGGPIVHNDSSPGAPAANRESLHIAVRGALAEAGVGPGVAIESGHVATTAAATELRRDLEGLLTIGQVTAGQDIEVVLATAGLTSGIALVAGTGVVAQGVSRDRAVTVGGWGWLLGDEGSAYWMGAEALRSVVRSLDGRGMTTTLTPIVLDELQVTGVPQLFDEVHRGRIDRPTIAALAVHVAALASLDQVARDIVDRAAQELYLLVEAAERAVPHADPVVVLAGGVLVEGGAVREALEQRLLAQGPPREIRSQAVPLAVAAARVAAQQAAMS